MQIKYIYDPEFIEPDKRECILNYNVYAHHNSIAEAPTTSDRKNDSYFIDLTQYGVLSKSAENILFKKYNCLKYMYEQTQNEEYLSEAKTTRNFLINHNLRLTKKIINRLYPNSPDIDDRTSDAYLWLMAAVESFDAGLGYKFSTYLVNAIYLNNRRKRPRKHAEIPMEECYDLRTEEDPAEVISKQDSNRYIREILASSLNSRDLAIIMHRYGIGTEPKKLREVGQILHITRERVRQRQAEILKRLLKVLQQRDTNGKSL